MSGNIIIGGDNDQPKRVKVNNPAKLKLQKQDDYEEDVLTIDETNIGDFDNIEEVDPFKNLADNISSDNYYEDSSDSAIFDYDANYSDVDLMQYNDYDYDDMEDISIRTDNINNITEENYDNGYIEPISYEGYTNLENLKPLDWGEGDDNQGYDESNYDLFDEYEDDSIVDKTPERFENRQNNIVTNYYNPDDYSDDFSVLNAIEAADIKENHQENHNDCLGAGYEDKAPKLKRKKKKNNSESSDAILGVDTNNNNTAEEVTFISSLKNLVFNIFNFNGYASVKEFWFSFIWIIIFVMLGSLINIIPVVGNIIGLIVYIALFIAQTSLTCRRFNDAGMFWWAPLVSVGVGVVGTIAAIAINMNAFMTFAGSLVASGDASVLITQLTGAGVIMIIGLLFSLINVVLNIIIWCSRSDKFTGIAMNIIYLAVSVLSTGLLVASMAMALGTITDFMVNNRVDEISATLNGEDVGTFDYNNISVDLHGYGKVDSSVIGDFSELEELFKQYGELEGVDCYSNGTDIAVFLHGTSDTINAMTPEVVNEVDGITPVEYANGYAMIMESDKYELMLVPGQDGTSFVMIVTNYGSGVQQIVQDVYNNAA